MVNAASTVAERGLATAAAPGRDRVALAALFALDDRLATILRTTREPMVGQMRLTWWHAALRALDDAPPPAEPVLRALAAEVLPRGVTGAALAAQVDGWEALLDRAVPGETAMAAFAAARGEGLFAAAAAALGTDADVAAAGGAWCLADLARHLSDPGAAARAAGLAADRGRDLFRPRWPRAARPLGLLTLAAMLDLEGVGGVRRAARLARHLATGG